MRKQNSTFRTAFLSESGASLENNDYFAYVELEQYACYVIADGLNDLPDPESARLATQNVILTFQENPSMSKRILRACLQAANQALCQADSRERLKASVMVVVTDYVKLRYAYAGNTRLRLYRDGIALEQSQDMSLSNEIRQEKRLAEDVLAKHEERNNLHTYVGQGAGFHPVISKKIRLQNGDILSLYTRGIWENLDSGELDDVFSEAGEEPQSSLDNIEDMLLTKQPQHLENYTFAAIFVNKVFLDPNRKRRIKKRIIAAILIAAVILVISLLIWFLRRQKEKRLEELELRYTNTIEYMQDGNFLRAEEECAEALSAAEKLKDTKRIQQMSDYQKLIEAVNAADEIYTAKDYPEAQEAYLTAQERSRYADRIADDYIQRRLEMTAAYISVYDYIQLGDTLTAQGDYKEAEKKYLEAKRLATSSYFESGRKDAVAALEAMYAGKTAEEEARSQEAQNKATDEVTAASLAAEGDKAFAEGDFAGAKLYYAMALEKYQELGDTGHAELLQTKIGSSGQKSEANKAKEQEAEAYVSAAREQEEAGDRLEAKKQYLFAKNLYRELRLDEKVAEIDHFLEILENDIAAEEKKKEESRAQEEEEAKAAEASKEAAEPPVQESEPSGAAVVAGPGGQLEEADRNRPQ